MNMLIPMKINQTSVILTHDTKNRSQKKVGSNSTTSYIYTNKIMPSLLQYIVYPILKWLGRRLVSEIWEMCFIHSTHLQYTTLGF